jgi:protein phosphatase
MRALQSGTEAEPDLSTIEAKAGDRYLLCSDGLSDVVSEETLRDTLIRCTDRDQAVTQLIELAIRGGGPDNITCIVADVVDSVANAPAGQVSVVGAASNGDGRPRVHADSPAGRAHLLTQAGPAVDVAEARPTEAPDLEDVEDDRRADHRAARRRWPVVTSVLVVLVVVIVGGLYAAWRYTQNQYYVGTDGSQVIIYRGVNEQVLGMSLSSVYQRTGIPLAHVPANDLPQVRSTITAGSLAAAQKTVSNIRQTITCNSYDAAYAKWAALPTTRKVTVTVGGKKQVRTEPVPRPAAPKTPTGCTPQGTSG